MSAINSKCLSVITALVYQKGLQFPCKILAYNMRTKKYDIDIEIKSCGKVKYIGPQFQVPGGELRGQIISTNYTWQNPSNFRQEVIRKNSATYKYLKFVGSNLTLSDLKVGP